MSILQLVKPQVLRFVLKLGSVELSLRRFELLPPLYERVSKVLNLFS